MPDSETHTARQRIGGTWICLSRSRAISISDEVVVEESVHQRQPYDQLPQLQLQVPRDMEGGGTSARFGAYDQHGSSSGQGEHRLRRFFDGRPLRQG